MPLPSPTPSPEQEIPDAASIDARQQPTEVVKADVPKKKRRFWKRLV